MVESPRKSLVTLALKGHCPACGEGSLFDGVLELAPKCSACGLSFAGQDSGDGPVFFILMLLAVGVGGTAFAVEILFAPPFWVHALLWPPIILTKTILWLRWFKAAFIIQQYRTRPEDFDTQQDDL